METDKLKEESSAPPPPLPTYSPPPNNGHDEDEAEEDSDNDDANNGATGSEVAEDDDDDDDDDDTSSTVDDDDDDEYTSSIDKHQPASKYSVFQKVIARDKDGLMYDAVVRRCMYGVGEPRQIPIGLFSNEEAEVILKKREEQEREQGNKQEQQPPSWHYFVHYNKWAVNWDRWINEEDVYEPTDEIKAYAARVMKENRDLQNKLSSVKKGKKKKQTIDGSAFLREWRQRLARIDEEMGVSNPLLALFTTNKDPSSKQQQANSKQEEKDKDSNDGVSSSTSDKKPKAKSKRRQQASSSTAAAPISRWSKAMLEEEVKNRTKHNLTSMRKQEMAKLLVIPNALQKLLVDQWELISQCNMLSSLPAQVTVRQVLDQYLATKAVVVVEAPQEGETAAEDAATNADLNGDKTADSRNTPPPASSAKADSQKDEPADYKPKALDAVDAVGAASLPDKDQQESLPKQETDTPTEAKENSTSEEEKEQPTKMDVDKTQEEKESTESGSNKSNKVVPEEWIEMGDGICNFFDQALPSKLLYQQEIPQLRVLDTILPEELKDKRFSEIYGAEYLLRLFIGLPEVLVDGFADMAAKKKDEDSNYDAVTRTILAKVSDLIRFLHKNQPALFSQAHRPWMAVELKEKQKMAQAQARRKRAHAQILAQSKSSNSTSSPTSDNPANDVKIETTVADSEKSPPSEAASTSRKKRKTSSEE